MKKQEKELAFMVLSSHRAFSGSALKCRMALVCRLGRQPAASNQSTILWVCEGAHLSFCLWAFQRQRHLLSSGYVTIEKKRKQQTIRTRWVRVVNKKKPQHVLPTTSVECRQVFLSEPMLVSRFDKNAKAQNDTCKQFVCLLCRERLLLTVVILIAAASRRSKNWF